MKIWSALFTAEQNQAAKEVVDKILQEESEAMKKPKQKHWVEIDNRGTGRITLFIQGDRIQEVPGLKAAVQKVVDIITADNKDRVFYDDGANRV